ncbi:MAG: ABC transporter substrate-binding protein [Acidimicrobiales bacterium]|jgi:ABC-type transport system substrate-binding protein|nr:ABC transporter substrate-binding protein [Acidimicrobiales bacterium]
MVDRTTGRLTARLLAGLVAIGLLLAACGSGDDAEEEEGGPGATEGADGAEQADGINLVESDEPGTPGGSITYGLSAETNGWNPTASQWAGQGWLVMRTMFDTLSMFDDQLQIQPNLAESFEHNEDYTEWRIILREGVTFHNGEPVTADAVKRNQEALKASPLTGDAYGPIEGFSVADERTVVVTTELPYVTYPQSLASQIGTVSEPDWLESGETRQPVGTGPFEMQEWISDDSLTVVRNDAWWRTDSAGQQLPYLDSITFRILTDPSARNNAIERGEIDIMQATDPDQILRFQNAAEDQGWQVFNDTQGESSETFVMLNTAAAPFDNPDARRAVALATDQEEFAEIVGSGLFPVADSPYPEGSPWYTETDYPEFDQEAARQLVEKVKQDTGSFTVSLVTTPNTTGQKGAAVIQQQWQDVGIEVELKPLDQAQLIGSIISGLYQATLWIQFGAPTPLQESVWWHPQNVKPPGTLGLNFARNDDDRIGTALDQARAVEDPAEQKRLYNDVVRYLNEDLPYIWLIHSESYFVAEPNLVNLVNYTLPDGAPGLPVINGSHPLWQVWIDQDAPTVGG